MLLADSSMPSHEDGVIKMVRFGSYSRPFIFEINDRSVHLNALTFSVLLAVFSQYVRHGKNAWPKGSVLGGHCAKLREMIEQRSRPPTNDEEASWSSWLLQARRELRAKFSDTIAFALLPDGHACRCEGMFPRVSENCKIIGLNL